jgi:hypothetical protein
MVTHGLRVEPLATGRTVCAQIGTEKHVVAVIGHGGKIPVLVQKVTGPLVTVGAIPVSVPHE